MWTPHSIDYRVWRPHAKQRSSPPILQCLKTCCCNLQFRSFVFLWYFKIFNEEVPHISYCMPSTDVKWGTHRRSPQRNNRTTIGSHVRMKTQRKLDTSETTYHPCSSHIPRTPRIGMILTYSISISYICQHPYSSFKLH